MKTETVSIRLTPETKQVLEHLAEQDKRPLGAYIRIVLEGHAEYYGRSYHSLRKSYKFHSWLIGYNNTNSTQYRPSIVPDSVIEQFIKENDEHPSASSPGN